MSGKAAAAGVGLFLAVFALYASDRWFASSDTFRLLDGVAVIDRCLEAGVYRDCEGRFGGLGGSAPLQYLPALTMKRAGASREDVLQYLAWLNTAAFAGLLLVLWRIGVRAGPRTTALLLLVGMVGPLVWYADSGFGEPLGAFLIALFAASLLLGWNPALTFGALILAGLAKAPNLFFLTALGAALLWARRGTGRALWPQGAAIAGGAAALALALAWIDRFRGGAVSSESYVAVADGVELPGWLLRLEHLAGLLFAPNAGLLWFWPLAVAALVGFAVLALRVTGRGDARRGAAIGVAVVAAALAGGIASYYAPFGWEAWGPRYLVPWIPALVAVGAALLPAEAEAALSRLTTRASRAALIAMIGLVALAGLPHLGARLDLEPPLGLFQPDEECPRRLLNPALWNARYGEVDSYYECTRHIAWGKRLVLVESLQGLRSGWGAALGFSHALAVGLLLAFAWGARPHEKPDEQ